MARSVRIFLRLAGILLALILLLAGALIFLATTATGLSLTTKALDRWVPGLSIEKSDGDWRHLTLTGIGWTSPGVDVKAEKLVIELDWYRLFDKKLKLGRLEIDRPEALVETAKLPQQEAVPEESAPFELPDLKLPIGITLEGIAARDAKAVINGETIELKSLDAELDLHDGILKLSKFSLAGISSGLGRIPAGAAQFDAAARMSREGVVIEEAALSEGHADLSNLSSPALASEEAQPAGEASTSASVLVPAPASLPLAPSHQTYLERVKGIFAEPFIKTLPVVKLPFDAELRSLKASGIRLEGIPGTEGLPGLSPLEIRTIDAKASMKASHVEIERFQLESSAADLALSGSADLDGAWPVNLSLEVRADAAPWGTLVGLRFDSPEAECKTTLSGEIAGALHLEAMTKGPVAMTLKAAANPGEADLPFSLSLASDEIKSPEILAASSEKAETAGSDAAPQVSGTPPAASEKTPLNEEASSRPGIAGTFAKSRYIVRNLALEAAGRPSAWELALKGNPVIEAPDALLGRETRFEGTLDADASGDLSGIRLSKFDLVTPLGELNLSGEADWKKDLAWKTALKVRGVDFEPWIKKLPLRLGADFSGEGLLRTDGTYRVDSAKLKLDGAIQKAPVRLATEISGTSELSWKVSDFDFLLGRNTLRFAGEVEHMRGITLDLSIDAPGLLNTIPGLSGRANGTVKLAGSLAHPIAQANVRASGLSWENLFSLGGLNLFVDMRNSPFKGAAPQKGGAKDGEPLPPPAPPANLPPPPAANASLEEKMAFIFNSLAGGEIQGSASLMLTDLAASGVALDSAEASLKGTEGSHVIALALSGDPISGSIRAAGKFSRDTLSWTGSLTEARVETPAGTWLSRNAAPLSWDPKTAQLAVGTHCWMHEDAKVCLPKPMVLGRAGEAHLALKSLNVEVLKPYLRKKSDRIAGSITGSADFRWDLAKNPMPSGQVTLNGDGLSYSTRWQGVRFPVTLEKLRAHALITGKRVALAWEVKPEGNGSSFGELAVIDPEKERRLDGRIVVDGITPSFIQPFLSRGERAEGAVNARLRAAGTLSRPELYGRAGAENVVVDADFIPIEMEPSNVEIEFNGRTSTLSGEIRTKTESVILSGNASWESLERWKADARVRTEGLHLSLPPMIQVDVKGDVTAEATNASASLKGRIEIPKSMIEVKTLPSTAIAVSEDQVLLDSNLQPRTVRTDGMPISGDVTVVLGPEVRIAAYGLRAGLSGEVRFVMAGGRMGLLGQINVPMGRFRAYGQDLVIQSGQILFSGPMTNPTLRLEAIRNPENTADGVTAGIRVTGTAESPQVTLFSTPQLSEQETLSYLIRGEGLGSEEGSSASMMTSMLIGVGTSQGSGILSEVGDAVGLRGLGVDTTGTGDSQQVVVSAYVLPGLQVKYGVGIFDSLATLTLRYRLMPRLYLEAVSGVEQALDLLYRFEF